MMGLVSLPPRLPSVDRVMPVPVRYYQEEAREACASSYESGRRKMVVEIPTGGGKTWLMWHILQWFYQHGWYDARALIVLPSIELVRQTYKSARSFFPEWMLGVVQAEQNILGRPITIASVDTLALPERMAEVVHSVGGPNRFTFIALDECFPYDTLIQTDQGLLPIGRIVEHSLKINVLSYNSEKGIHEWKPVKRHLKKQAIQLVQVVHERGTLTCTPTHKLWIEGRGYVQAKDLHGGEILRMVPTTISSQVLLTQESKDNTVLQQILQQPVHQESSPCQSQPSRALRKAVGREGMRILWRNVLSPFSWKGDPVSTLLQSVMQKCLDYEPARIQGVPSRSSQSGTQETTTWKEESRNSRANETEQSYEQTRGSRENASIASRTPIQGTRREWEPNSCSMSPFRDAWTSNRVCRPHSAGQRTVPLNSQLVQGGYCRPTAQDCYRSRWQGTSSPKKPSHRSEEDRCPDCSRVVCVTFLQSTDHGGSGSGGSTSQTVYDLEVADNHNYYADAVLVSNCHGSLSQSYATILEVLEHPYALRLGVTATPFRQDGRSLLRVFPDGLVYYVDLLDLIAQGYLVRPIPYAVETNLDLEGVALSLFEQSDEGNDAEREALSDRLIDRMTATNRYAKAYTAWQQIIGGERTLLFADSVKDAYAFHDYFCGQDAPSEVITGMMSEGRRTTIYERYHEGDIRVICNYGVLTTGVDFTRTGGIIIARSSLMGEHPNRGLHQQVVGRGLRLSDERDDEWGLPKKRECKVVYLIPLQKQGARPPILMSWGMLPGTLEDPPKLLTSPRSEEDTPEELLETDDLEAGEVLTELSLPPPEEMTLRLKSMQAAAIDVFAGSGWVSHPEGSFSRQTEIGTLIAERAGGLTSQQQYQVYLRYPSGITRCIVPEPCEARDARARGTHYVARKLEEQKMKRGEESTEARAPATPGQLKMLQQRRVPVRGPKMPTQGDVWRIVAFLDEHGGNFRKGHPAIMWQNGHTSTWNHEQKKNKQVGDGSKK